MPRGCQEYVIDFPGRPRFSDVFGCFPMISRSDEYGEGPKGPASTGEEAEMGFEAKRAEKPIELSSKIRCIGWPI